MHIRVIFAMTTVHSVFELTSDSIVEMKRNIFEKIQVPGAQPSDPDWHITRWGFHSWDELLNNMCGTDKSDYPPPTVFDIASLDCMQEFANEPKQKKIKLFFKKVEIKNIKKRAFDPYGAHSSQMYYDWLNDSVGQNSDESNITVEEQLNTSYVNDEDAKMDKQLIHASFKAQLLRDEDDLMVLDGALMADKEIANKSCKEQMLADEDDNWVVQVADETIRIEQCKIDKVKMRAQEQLFWENYDKECKKTHKQYAHASQLDRIDEMDRLDCNRIKGNLENHFFAIRTWPAFAVNLLLTPTFNYNDRITLAAFFHGNGLVNSERAIRYFQFYNPYWKLDRRQWKQKLYLFTKLFLYLDKAHDFHAPEYHHVRNNYYYYSMIVKHMLYYNGNKRKNSKPANEFLHYTYPY